MSPIPIWPTLARRLRSLMSLGLVTVGFLAAEPLQVQAAEAPAQASAPTPATSRAPLRFLGNAAIAPIVSSRSGKAEGVAVDLASAAAAKAGLVIAIEALDWQQAQRELSEGQADALIQINPNPERLARLDFSEPLLESNFHIFRKANRTDIGGLASLAGRKVGVERAGFPIQFLRAHPEIGIVEVDRWSTAFRLLVDGQLDAVFVDRWVGEYELHASRLNDVTVVDPPVITDHSRIAVAKGNRALLDRINSGLKAIQADGTRQAILDRWSAKQVIYLTRESVERWVIVAVVSGGLVLLAFTLAVVLHARRLRRVNAELELSHAQLNEAMTQRGEALALAHDAQDRLQALVDQQSALVAARTADLTVAKELAESANRAKSAFLASMSHELRTPMNAIMGLNAILLHREADPSTRDLHRKIDNASQHLLALISDILDVTRFEADRVSLSHRPMTLGGVMADMEAMLGIKPGEMSLQFRVEASAELLALPLVGDPMRLGQIFNNLVGNALKFTDQGSVVVRLRAVHQDAQALVLRAEVADTGIGIAAQDQTRIFMPFEQADNSNTRRHGGAGLGLAICRRLAMLMGGEIHVESEPGRGSTFWFTARLAVSDSAVS